MLDGVTVIASPTLEVMGLSLRVGISMYELMAPAMTRARSKFWELKHIFRTKGHMKNRARVMERVIGGTALWFICCVPPDKATMTSLNATQLQLMVWLLHFAKGSNESWEQFRMRAFRGHEPPCTQLAWNDGALCGCVGTGGMQGREYVPAYLSTRPSVVSLSTSGRCRGGGINNRSPRVKGFVTRVITSPGSPPWKTGWTRSRGTHGGH